MHRILKALFLLRFILFFCVSGISYAQQSGPSTGVTQGANSAPNSTHPEPPIRLMKRTVIRIQTDCREKDEKGAYKTKSYSGTGFLVGYEDARFKGMYFSYLVTNRHVIMPGIEDGATCEVIQRILRVDRKVADATGSFTKVVLLAPEEHWSTPSDPSIDLAVIRIRIAPEVYDVLYYPTHLFLTQVEADESNVAEGDPVLFTGVFTQFTGQVRSEPIVRTGKIAMVPGEQVPTTLHHPGIVYLVDAHVFGGNSGSPLFINLGGPRGDTIGPPDIYRLLGIVSGYVKETSDFQLQSVASYAGTLDANSGIAMVVPAQQLLDLLDTPSLMKGREDNYKRFGTPTSK